MNKQIHLSAGNHRNVDVVFVSFERDENILFEGQKTGEQYSEESLAKVLKNALSLCKITKPVTLHWLRH